IIANRDFPIDPALTHTLIHALIASAHKNQPRCSRQFLRDRLAKWLTHRRHQNAHGFRLTLTRKLQRSNQRLGLHHHASAAPERNVISRFVFIRRKRSNIDRFYRKKLFFDTFCRNTGRQRTLEILAKKTEYLNCIRRTQDSTSFLRSRL